MYAWICGGPDVNTAKRGLALAIWICVLINKCLDFCVFEGMLGFVAEPDLNTARVDWFLQSVLISVLV